MSIKTKIFLTGASGIMGFAVFKELYERKNLFDIVILLRDSDKNRKKFSEYVNDNNVKIIWGDLTKYSDVLECVKGVNIILHVGGLVSPACDNFPKQTLKTNIKSMENIVNAVKSQSNKNEIKVVNIGTIAQTGYRNAPVHWGRIGDPIQISVYDHYAISKCKAECILAESGLKYWVSIRAGALLYPELTLKGVDPIIFHVPLNGVLEWLTVDDSAQLLANICGTELPEKFWKNFYNASSGHEYRLTNYEFETLMLNAIGMTDQNIVKKLFEANWFTLRNFHGHWYTDGDLLENYLHFRHNTPLKEYFDKISRNAPTLFKFSYFAPKSMIKKLMMEPIANDKDLGTQSWIKDNNEDRINVFYGGLEAYNSIGTWENFELLFPDKTDNAMTYLNHGYDENKNLDELTIGDLKDAAQFRGGECLTENINKDLYTPIKWKCCFGHHFEMSPNLVLKGGYWCPECLPMPWKDDEIAKKNKFFAQVYYSHHKSTENNIYTKEIFDGYKESF